VSIRGDIYGVVRKVSIMGVRTERMNVWVSPETKNWIQQEAERLGVAQGAVIEWAIESYRIQREALNIFPRFMELAEKLKEAGK